MSAISENIKKNPLQTITVGIAVLGVAFSVFNFYLLANITPVARRVEALEIYNDNTREHIEDLIEMKATVEAIRNDVSDIKSDIKELFKTK